MNIQSGKNEIGAVVVMKSKEGVKTENLESKYTKKKTEQEILT